MHHELWPANQILSTKIRIPALASNIVERPRLYARLDAGLRQPLTILSAPPGYGKTTLVADWLRRMNSGLSRAWVSLTRHDNTSTAFWSYVFAALDYAVLESTSQFTALLHTAQEYRSETTLIQLINVLSERAAPLILVIDNYQYITSPEVNESLAFVIEHLPEQVHVVLMTNYDPPLPPWAWVTAWARWTSRDRHGCT